MWKLSLEGLISAKCQTLHELTASAITKNSHLQEVKSGFNFVIIFTGYYIWKLFIYLRCLHAAWLHGKRFLTAGNAICNWWLINLSFLTRCKVAEFKHRQWMSKFSVSSAEWRRFTKIRRIIHDQNNEKNKLIIVDWTCAWLCQTAKLHNQFH